MGRGGASSSQICSGLANTRTDIETKKKHNTTTVAIKLLTGPRLNKNNIGDSRMCHHAVTLLSDLGEPNFDAAHMWRSCFHTTHHGTRNQPRTNTHHGGLHVRVGVVQPGVGRACLQPFLEPPASLCRVPQLVFHLCPTAVQGPVIRARSDTQLQHLIAKVVRCHGTGWDETGRVVTLPDGTKRRVKCAKRRGRRRIAVMVSGKLDVQIWRHCHSHTMSLSRH